MDKKPDFSGIETSIPDLHVPGIFDAIIEYAPVKALLPIPVILLLAPAIWYLFRSTWKTLDDEARQYAQTRTETDYRPAVALVLLAITMTIHEYYGGRRFFTDALEPMLRSLEKSGQKWVKFEKYQDLYSYFWWSFSRILGYVIVPIAVWKTLFRTDSILDMGLRTKGFFSHIWIYGLCLVVVFAAMGLLANQQDFLTYYPFYKGASRSWFDLLMWEAFYFAQFLALEFYFRGFLLQAMRRTMGASAIFVVAVPYCMIHFGKPYLEAHGAIIAGIVLGSLAMRTRSIYAGFLVHITVAGLMDYMALASRDALPTRFWPS